MARVCYTVQPEDKAIAKLLGENYERCPYMVATYRGLYDSDKSHKTPFDIDGILTDQDKLIDAAARMANFIRESRRKRYTEINSVGTNSAPAISNMGKIYSTRTLKDRTNLISSRVSAKIDRLHAMYPEYSRKQLLQGIKDADGNMIGGQFAIFDEVYADLLAEYYDYHAKAANPAEDPKKVEKYKYKEAEYWKMIENWPALLLFVRKDLLDKESVVLGNTMDYCEDADEEDFNDNSLSEDYTPEESTREHWNEQYDKRSDFGSLGKEVRRLLSRIYHVVHTVKKGFKPDTGEVTFIHRFRPDFDDLGNRRFVNPRAMHRMLQEAVKYVRNSKEFMSKLTSTVEYNNMMSEVAVTPYLLDDARYAKKLQDAEDNMLPSLPGYYASQLLDLIKRDPQLITQLWNDLHRNLELYSEQRNSQRLDGSEGFFYKLLNKPSRNSVGMYLRKLASIGTSEEESYGDTVYNSTTGTVNFVNMSKWIAKVNALSGVSSADTSTGNIFKSQQVRQYKSTFWSLPIEQKVTKLNQLCEEIGVNVSYTALKRICSNYSELVQMVKTLKNIAGDSGFKGTFGTFLKKAERADLSPEEKKELESGEIQKQRQLYRKAFLKSDKSSNKLRKHMTTLLGIVERNTEDIRGIKTKVLTKDRKGKYTHRYSNVYPCYLGDKIEEIKGYVINNDKEGLRKFLEENYLNCPYFRDPQTNTIYNRWFKDLWDACDPDSKRPLAESPAAQLMYERFLGSNIKQFEDFSDRQHAVNLLNMYFSTDEEGSGKFPVFILGDSGVSKFITFTKYSKESILDDMMLIYKQEIERMKEAAAVEEYLTKTGMLENGWEKNNPDGSQTHIEGAAYALLQNFHDTKNEFTMLPFLNAPYIKDGISYDLKTAPEYIIREAIEQRLNEGFERFKQDMRKLGVLDKTGTGAYKYISDIVTVDKQTGNDNLDQMLEEVYYNLKFATIEQLQFMTIDTAFYGLEVKNGKVIGRTKDLQKRFKETHAPGTTLDVFACWADGTPVREVQDGKVYQRGLYFNDVEEEGDSMFLDLIKRVHGEESRVYRKYKKKSSLTDGQGYRTLDSFRDIMRMAGQWSDEGPEEQAYRTIKAICSKYGRNENLSEEDAAIISKLTVTFQPLKPFLFTHEKMKVNGTTIVPIPVQHKYAEAIIIPELLPANSKLRDLGYFMQDHKIDVAMSTKAAKVGAFGQVDISHLDQYDEQITQKRTDTGDTNTEITNSDRLSFALGNAYVHNWDLQDYRIQTNVPNAIYHSRLEGTQQRKIVLFGVRKRNPDGSIASEKIVKGPDGKNHYQYEHYIGYETVNLGDKNADGSPQEVHLTGNNLIRFFNMLQCTKMFKAMNRFLSIERDKTKFANYLIQNTLNSSKYDVDTCEAFGLENEDFALALFEGCIEHDTSSGFLALFKKIVNKITTNGGSGVQVSALGIKDYSEDGGLRVVCADKNGDVIDVNQFNLKAIDRSKVDIEISTDPNQHEGNRTLKIYLKDAHDKGWFELVKDREEGQYSVHFKTSTSEHMSEKYAPSASTKEDRNILFEQLRRAIPKGATISTWGNISKGGIHGLERLGIGMVKVGERTIKDKQGNDMTIPIYQNGVAEADNVLWFECEIPFKFSYTNAEGETIDLEYTDYCNPDGTLKTNAEGTPLIDIDYPGIRDIVAYRIPTEQSYSMLNLKAVRFTQNITGGTIKVPLQCTTISGFDFDIDKLYFMRKEFKEVMPYLKRVNLTNEQRAAIVEKIEELHPGVTDIVPAVTEDIYDPEDLAIIFDHIYRSIPGLREELKEIRKKTPGRKRPLNFYLDKSEIFQDLAKKEGAPDVKTYKQHLVMSAAIDTGTLPYIETKKNEYRVINADKAKGMGYTKQQLYEEAAKELGIALKERKNEKWTKYNFRKVPWKNREVDVKNMALELTRQRLMDKETLEMRTTPNGFDGAKRAGRTIRELIFGNPSDITTDGHVDFDKINARINNSEIKDPEPEYDPSELMTLITYNQMNQAAANLIGVFANQNSNHALASLLEEFSLKPNCVIEFAGHLATEGYGKSILIGPKGVDLAANMAEFLAASVDAVKDPVLNYMNLNMYTANTGALLVRLGYNATEIALLFNQPIIKQVTEYAKNNNLSLDEAIRDVTNQLSHFKFTRADFLNNSKSAVSSQSLADNIMAFRSDEKVMNDRDFALKQMQALQVFKRASEAAEQVNQFILSTKATAANAVQANFGDMYAAQMRIDNYLATVRNDKENRFNITLSSSVTKSNSQADHLPIKNDEGRLLLSEEEYMEDISYNPLAYEQTMTDLIRQALKEAGRYFPYGTRLYKTVREALRNMTRSRYLDGDTINSIHSDLLVYILSQFEFSEFNGDKIVEYPAGNSMSARKYYLEEMPKSLFRAWDDYHKKMDREMFDYESEHKPHLYDYLAFDMDDDGNLIINIQASGSLEGDGKEVVKSLWRDFAKENPDRARELFMYCFHKSGYDFGMNTFIQLAPTSLKKSIKIPLDGSGETYITYADIHKDILSGNVKINYSDFMQRYILNHPENPKFTYEIKSKTARNIIEPKVKKEDDYGRTVYADTFELDCSKMENNSGMFILQGNAQAGLYMFVPMLKIDDVYYVASSNDVRGFNISSKPTMTYRKVTPRGEGNRVKNYSDVTDLSSDKASKLSDMDYTKTEPAELTSENLEIRQELETTFMDALREGYKEKGWDFDDDAVSKYLKGVSTEELFQLVETIKRACRDGKDKIVLDDEGNPQILCK